MDLISGDTASDTDGRPTGDPDRDPRNAIVLIPDGASSAHISAARYLKAYQDDPDAHPLNVGAEGGRLHIDDTDARGEMGTFPDDPDHNITDSAAAGTAMATGRKTYNGAIGGVDRGSGHEPVETILEKAWNAGMATGLVTTTRMTHATPAAFATHIASRDEEDEIASQYIDGGKVDVLLGGGRSHFDENHRNDGRDLLGEAADEGYSVVETGEELTDASGKTLGLFGSEVSRTTHMSYSVDRHNGDSSEPMLYDMAEQAVEILSSTDRGRKNGFFLMVESGRVDHAGHSNDPVIAAEQLEADKTFGRLLEYTREESEPETLLVQAPDHETGGLSLGHDAYDMDWSALADLRMSGERFRERYHGGMDASDALGIELSSSERNRIEQDPDAVTDVVSSRAGVGWGSIKHTAESVPIYAAGAGAEQFNARIDNTDLPARLADVLRIEAAN